MLSVSKGQNNEDVMNMNRIMVIQYLQRNGVCSRAQISNAIGLTQASISKMTANLIQYNIIQEVGSFIGKSGRRSKGIMLSPNLGRVIGVKLSRRSFSVGVFDFTGILADSHSETFSETAHIVDVIEKIKSVILEYLKKFHNILAIGIAVPGPFLQKEGKILLMTEMPDWKSISLKEAFQGFCDVPIIIRHDANSGALAEWWFTSQCKKRKGTLIYFLAGEGVGAGVIVNGNILMGDQGIAGEIGHVSIDIDGRRCACGNRGCLEMYCSSLALVKGAQTALQSDNQSILNRFHPLNAESIFAAMDQNDPLAVQLVKQAGTYLGYGVVNLINVYNPSTIVIGDEMAHGGNLLLDSVKSVVQERVLSELSGKVTIELSTFQHDPILYGAAAIAIDYCLSHPMLLAHGHS